MAPNGIRDKADAVKPQIPKPRSKLSVPRPGSHGQQRPPSGGARGHPGRGSLFPDRGAEVSAGSTLPCKLPPPTSSHYIYCEVEAQLTSCMHISRN